MGTIKRYRGVRCYLPKGRTASTIYLVTLKEHPGVVKVGRTTKWVSRRRAYDTWNLADGDGVQEYAVYTFVEEAVDLPQLETVVITALRGAFPVRRGKEWFEASFEEARRIVEQVLEAYSLEYL